MRSAANRQLIHLRSRCLLPVPVFCGGCVQLDNESCGFPCLSLREGGAPFAARWPPRRCGACVARRAGEALRPSRTKPCATIPSDRPRPSPRGAPTPSATTTTTGSSARPSVTVVGLVVARERAAAVYCKRTGGCRIRSRVDYPRGRYVRRTPRGLSGARTPGRTSVRASQNWITSKPEQSLILPHRPHLSPPSAGIGDARARGLRARWNSYAERPDRPLDGARASPSSPPPATSSAILTTSVARWRSRTPKAPARLDARAPAPRASRAMGRARARSSPSLGRGCRRATIEPLTHPPGPHAAVEDLSEYSVAHFLGRSRGRRGCRVRSRRVRVDAMGATSRPTLWITQGHGTCVEASSPRRPRRRTLARWRRRRDGWWNFEIFSCGVDSPPGDTAWSRRTRDFARGARRSPRGTFWRRATNARRRWSPGVRWRDTRSRSPRAIFDESARARRRAPRRRRARRVGETSRERYQ